jgi:hypothetical protein
MRTEGLYTTQQAMRQVAQERDFARHRVHTVRFHGYRGHTEMLWEVHQFADRDEVPPDHMIVAETTFTLVPFDVDGFMARQREEFEDKMFALYERGHGAALDDGGDGSREGLLWREADGTYGVKQFNAAWYGWLAARGLEQT